MVTSNPHTHVPQGYVFVCNRDVIPERGKKTVHIDDRRVLIVATSDGLFAVEDRCPQTGGSIAHGEVLGTVITCPTVGARYDLRTGRYVGGGQSPLQSHWLPVLPLYEADDEIYIRVPTR